MRVGLTHDESTWHSVSAIMRLVRRGNVRRGVTESYNITTHWTEARVSQPFIVELVIAVLSSRPVNSGVRPLSEIYTLEICYGTRQKSPGLGRVRLISYCN